LQIAFDFFASYLSVVRGGVFRQKFRFRAWIGIGLHALWSSEGRICPTNSPMTPAVLVR
jgi:hypothetical protein